jgi:NAD(P)-dependent dehydrogenase (short-subunit alcohol dehydrogenase family)
MTDRAAIVTGASRGIGRVIAETLAAEGYSLTISARRPVALDETVTSLRAAGHDVQSVTANIAEEDAVREIVDRHRHRFGRLDVLVNNAGVGIGAQAGEHLTKHIDLQLGVNLRAIILFYREALDLLRQAGAEHGHALVINMASIAGKSPQPWLSVYSAAKAGAVAYTRAMNRELVRDGVKSVAFCPGFVDTDMSDFIKGEIAVDDMLRTQDIAAAVRLVLQVSNPCVIPEIMFARHDDV